VVSIDPLLMRCKSFRAIARRSGVDACGNRGAVSKDLWARGVGASKRSVRSGSIHSDGKGPEASVGPALLRVEAPVGPRMRDLPGRITMEMTLVSRVARGRARRPERVRKASSHWMLR